MRGHNYLIHSLTISFLFFTLFVSCATNSRTYDAQQDTELQKVGTEYSSTKEYTLEKGDSLFISVWDEEDLKAEVTIRPDGKISFPLAGEIPAVGLTFTQLNGELTQRLKKYIQGPIVSIQFKKFGGKKVIILGEVKDPGVYAVTGNKTVLEAVAMANGFTPDAVSSSVVLIRGGLQNPVGQRLDLKDALERPDNGQNVAVLSEDIVYVPRTYIASVSRVLQQIVSPIAQGIFAVRGYQLIE